MAKPNYSFEKRQREIAKKKKKEDASATPIAKRVMGASAFTGVGIKEAVEWMCNAVNGSERQRELDFV